jgi:hypothetical protein
MTRNLNTLSLNAPWNWVANKLQYPFFQAGSDGFSRMIGLTGQGHGLGIRGSQSTGPCVQLKIEFPISNWDGKATDKVVAQTSKSVAKPGLQARWLWGLKCKPTAVLKRIFHKKSVSKSAFRPLF